MQPSDRTMARRAWLNAGLHVLGLIVAATVIRPGSTAVAVPERLNYLADSRVAWTLAWCVWIAAALAMVWFTHGVARRLATPGAWVAFGLSAGAAVLDISCDAVWIASAAPGSDLRVFETWQRVAFVGGASIANGLYTLGVLLLVRAMRRPLREPVARLGLAVVLVGFLFSAVALTGPIELIYATSGITLVAYAAWAVAVARSLGSPSCG